MCWARVTRAEPSVCARGRGSPQIGASRLPRAAARDQPHLRGSQGRAPRHTPLSCASPGTRRPPQNLPTTARVNITLKISPGTSYSSQIVIRGAKLFRPLHSARSNQHQQCERLKKHVFSLRMCDYKTTAKHGLSRNSSLALGVTVTSSWRASGEKNLHASFTSTTPAPSRSVASPRRTCSRCVKIGVDSSSVYV
eukprot:COSAG06_NODE_2181_length_7402_cov_8.928933_2_plen_195_part_00